MSPDARRSVTCRVTLTQGNATEHVFFRVTGADITKSPMEMEALVPLVLVPAMRLGSPLRFQGPLDRVVLAGAKRFQEIFSVWYPEFQPVPIHAEVVDRGSHPGRAQGVGVFFSGGLDSSYSLLKNCGELTHAIFIHGCDIPLANTGFRDRTVARLTETAKECGVSLIVIETDLLRFSDTYCHWGHHYHGAAMAGMAGLLGGTLRKVYVASSTSYLRIVPWGSTMVTDPLWSTGSMEVVHDGAEQERMGKIRRLIQSPVALRNLRVCFENPDDGYNCGQCEKCFRTMDGLRLCGALNACGAFDRPLDLAAMISHPEVLEKFGKLRSWTINYEMARSMGTDLELIQALEELHRLSSYLGLVQLMCREKNFITTTPHWRSSLPKFRTALFASLRDEDPAWFTGKILQWLPAARDQALERLANLDRPWFKRNLIRHLVPRVLRRDKKKRGQPEGPPAESADSGETPPQNRALP